MARSIEIVNVEGRRMVRVPPLALPMPSRVAVSDIQRTIAVAARMTDASVVAARRLSVEATKIKATADKHTNAARFALASGDTASFNKHVKSATRYAQRAMIVAAQALAAQSDAKHASNIASLLDRALAYLRVNADADVLAMLRSAVTENSTTYHIDADVARAMSLNRNGISGLGGLGEGDQMGPPTEAELAAQDAAAGEGSWYDPLVAEAKKIVVDELIGAAKKFAQSKAADAWDGCFTNSKMLCGPVGRAEWFVKTYTEKWGVPPEKGRFATYLASGNYRHMDTLTNIINQNPPSSAYVAGLKRKPSASTSRTTASSTSRMTRGSITDFLPQKSSGGSSTMLLAAAVAGVAAVGVALSRSRKG